MKKKLTLEQKDNITKAVFIIIEIALFALVFTTTGVANKLSSFGCVVNPFAYSLKFLSKDKVAIFTQTGLMFTIFADLFLVVIEPQFKEVAMTFFVLTQICYFGRLLSLAKHPKINVVIRVIFIAAAITATFFVLEGKTDYLSVISMIYYTNLVLNVLYAFWFIKKSPLFAIGMLLFLLCDTLIGIEVAAGTYLPIDTNSVIYRLTQLPFNLAWVFYAPSQGLIAYSLHKSR